MAIQFTNVAGNGGDIDTSGINAGATSIQGTGASESIKTGGAQDFINGAGGDDVIRSNHGRDTVFGGAGNDDINGQGSNDSLRGGDDNDTVDGGAGNDNIMGDAGDDIIIGGNGNDILWGDTGHGQKDGTVGNDTFIFDMDDGNDRVMDFVSGFDDIVLDGTAVALDGSSTDFTLLFNGTNTIVTYFDTTITFVGSELTMADFTFA
jgi:Ca2+-binding RTX toxin-like protein